MVTTNERTIAATIRVAASFLFCFCFSLSRLAIYYIICLWLVLQMLCHVRLFGFLKLNRPIASDVPNPRKARRDVLKLQSHRTVSQIISNHASESFTSSLTCRKELEGEVEKEETNKLTHAIPYHTTAKRVRNSI